MFLLPFCYLVFLLFCSYSLFCFSPFSFRLLFLPSYQIPRGLSLQPWLQNSLSQVFFNVSCSRQSCLFAVFVRGGELLLCLILFFESKSQAQQDYPSHFLSDHFPFTLLLLWLIYKSRSQKKSQRRNLPLFYTLLKLRSRKRSSGLQVTLSEVGS